jgi:hypothetical protein
MILPEVFHLLPTKCSPDQCQVEKHCLFGVLASMRKGEANGGEI